MERTVDTLLSILEIPFETLSTTFEVKKGKMTLQELKCEAYKAEQIYHSRKLMENAKAMVANIPKPKPESPTKPMKLCTKCGQRGHWKSECKSKGVICYSCNQLTDHISKDCPKRKKETEQTFSKKETEQTFKSNKFKSYKNKDKYRRSRKHHHKSKKEKGHARVARHYDSSSESTVSTSSRTSTSSNDSRPRRVNYASSHKGATYHAAERGKRISFIIDSGATEHLTNNLKILTNIKKTFTNKKNLVCE